MNNFIEGEYEDPSEFGSSSCALTQEGAHTPNRKKNLRVASVIDFEPAEVIPPEKLEAFLARFSVLFIDEDSARRGGIGTVYFASNSYGERFAVKTLNRDGSQDHISDEISDLLLERGTVLFREEFECHKKLSGLKGFPKLYGYCTLFDGPALVMECIEGVSIKDAQSMLSIDESGVLPPIVVGRIGRDLFDAISRLSILGDSAIHRDLSPANVMIRTSKLSLFEQVDEGFFDIYLIDFGSASIPCEKEPSFTENSSFVRKATPNYAPPEMLLEVNDESFSLHERSSTKIDVYAGASILFELCAGNVPFDLGEAIIKGESFYEYKKANKPAMLRFPHRTSDLLANCLAHEPELAVSLELNGHDLSASDQNLPDSIDFVDRQLSDLLCTCLRPEQEDRPEPDEVLGSLSSFCKYYYRNIELAYRGEPLIPCLVDGEPHGDADLLIEIRDAVRSVSKAASLAVLIVVALSAGFLTAGTPVFFDMGSFSWQGSLLGFDISALLVFPAFLGLAFSRSASKRKAFVLGTAAVVAGAIGSGLCLSGIRSESAGFQSALFAALAASSFAAWCPVAMDYALGKIMPLARRVKRKALPMIRRIKAQFAPTPDHDLPESVG